MVCCWWVGHSRKCQLEIWPTIVQGEGVEGLTMFEMVWFKAVVAVKTLYLLGFLLRQSKKKANLKRKATVLDRSAVTITQRKRGISEGRVEKDVWGFLHSLHGTGSMYWAVEKWCNDLWRNWSFTTAQENEAKAKVGRCVGCQQWRKGQKKVQAGKHKGGTRAWNVPVAKNCNHAQDASKAEIHFSSRWEGLSHHLMLCIRTFRRCAL